MRKVVAALMLMMAVVFVVGCKTPKGDSCNGHEYVDLGLPSGTLWATCNVGANTPEEYGDYFAWGETMPKDIYNWSTYRYGDRHQFTKYCSKSIYGYNGFTDNLTALLPEDDVAMTSWGDGWSVPTIDQWRELIDNTTNEWTTRNGVDGRLFTADNGSFLFLPAAGYRWFDKLYKVGSYGYYWSGSLEQHTYIDDQPWFFDFHSNRYKMSCFGFRSYGHSVRPVRSACHN